MYNISDLRVYAEREISSYVTSITADPSNFKPYGDDPLWTLGQTPESGLTHQYLDMILAKSRDADELSLTYNFGQRVMIDHVILLSRHPNTISISVLDSTGTTVGVCNSSVTLVGFEPEEIDCAKLIGHKLKIMGTVFTDWMLRLRKVMIFGNSPPYFVS